MVFKLFFDDVKTYQIVIIAQLRQPQIKTLIYQMTKALLSTIATAALLFASAGIQSIYQAIQRCHFANDEKLAFVYELVRHGARAPIIEEPKGWFQVKLGLLTATGMRQRNLLGSYNRQRYVEREGLLDEVYNPSQLYIQSTGVDRTIQSTYSELLGMYPPTTNQQQKKSLSESSISDKAMPPMKIRGSVGLEGTLKATLPLYLDSYVNVPVYSYLSKNTPDDDIQPGGCTYAFTYNSDHWNKVATYAGISDYIMPILREPVGKAFGYTRAEIDALTFVNIYMLSDVLLAENMEGDTPRYNFTSEQWHYIREAQKIVLLEPISDFARELWITKQFRKPMQAFHQRVNEILAQSNNTDTLRYMLYSAHDVQVANVLHWLQPVYFEVIDVPYASNFHFELSYNETCLQTVTPNKYQCFSVKVLYNNEPIHLGTCLDANQKAGRHTKTCTYTDFVAHIDSLSFKGDLAAECERPWNSEPSPFRKSHQISG